MLIVVSTKATEACSCNLLQSEHLLSNPHYMVDKNTEAIQHNLLMHLTWLPIWCSQVIRIKVFYWGTLSKAFVHNWYPKTQLHNANVGMGIHTILQQYWGLTSHYQHHNWSCGGNKERTALHNIPMQSPLWCDVHRNKKTAQTKQIKSSCRSLIRDPNS
jgi:hypothetical protein